VHKIPFKVWYIGSKQIKRERDALDDIRNNGHDIEFEPYD